MQIERTEPSAQLRTIEETMSLLRVGRSKIHQLQEKGALEFIKFGHRSVRVTQRSIDRLLEKYRIRIGRRAK